MNILIAEDEILAAERLNSLLAACDPQIRIIDNLDSVSDVVAFFKAGGSIDLLLLDIELADGKSFEIFDKIDIAIPIIFITAYNEFALDAFKYYSIDYLLKPVQLGNLQAAINKFKKISGYQSSPPDWKALQMMLRQATTPHKERFILKSGNKLFYKNASEIAYFFADGKTAYLVSKKENRKYIVDYTLEELEKILDPKMFFRINRKFIVSIDSLAEVKGLVSSRMEIKLNQPCEYELSVSRDRSHGFKSWLDQ
jgi:DNA-binding LytR/AlgR family response regulator